MLKTAEAGTCQGMDRNRSGGAYSHSEDNRGRDRSGHGKKRTERSALTSWGRQREGLVRTRKETDQARHTHNLETAGGQICQDTERNRLTKHTHKLETVEEGTCQDTETNRPRRCTHVLERAEVGACQDMERNRASEVHPLSGDGRDSNLSGHGKQIHRARCTHVLETAEGWTCQEMKKKPTERGTLTIWRQQSEGPVRTWKETDLARRTHILKTAEGGICQNTERNWPSEAHSRPGDGRVSDLSGH